MKHLSTLRKRKRIDFLSSGERKGKSLNHTGVKVRIRCSCEVTGSERLRIRSEREVTKNYLSETAWKGGPKKVIALYAKR